MLVHVREQPLPLCLRSSAASHCPVGAQVEIPFTPRPLVSVVGALAEKPLAAGQALRGVLLQGRSCDALLSPEDLPAFTKLRTGRVVLKQVGYDT